MKTTYRHKSWVAFFVQFREEGWNQRAVFEIGQTFHDWVTVRTLDGYGFSCDERRL